MSLRPAIPCFLFVIALPVLAQQAGPIPRMKLSDTELTCQQLYDETKQMENITAEAKGSREASQGTATAATAAAFIPFFGLFSGAVSQDAHNKQTNSVERMQQAAARQEHITQLFIMKGCKLSEVEGKQGENSSPDQPRRADQAITPPPFQQEPTVVVASVAQPPTTNSVATNPGSGNSIDLIQALKSKNEEAALILIGKGSDVNAMDEEYGATPLHWAILNGCKEAAAALIEKITNINAKTKNGATPLFTAASVGQKEILQMLIDRGADINAKDATGDSPLKIATKNRHVALVKILKAKGAKL